MTNASSAASSLRPARQTNLGTTARMSTSSLARTCTAPSPTCYALRLCWARCAAGSRWHAQCKGRLTYALQAGRRQTRLALPGCDAGMLHLAERMLRSTAMPLWWVGDNVCCSGCNPDQATRLQGCAVSAAPQVASCTAPGSAKHITDRCSDQARCGARLVPRLRHLLVAHINLSSGNESLYDVLAVLWRKLAAHIVQTPLLHDAQPSRQKLAGSLLSRTSSAGGCRTKPLATVACHSWPSGEVAFGLAPEANASVRPSRSFSHLETSNFRTLVDFV
jgi:hypothetical protein